MRMRTLTVPIAIIWILGAVSTSLAQLPGRIDTLSAWGGAVNCFQKVGTIGYCGSGQRLVVLDMSVESNIHEIGSINLDSTVEDVLIRGTYAYVLTGVLPYFVVLDVSTPTSPRLVWSESNTHSPLHTLRLRLYGNLLYLLDPTSGVAFAYNLTNPALPSPIETGSPGSGYFWVDFYNSGLNLWLRPSDMQIVGHYAYIIGGSQFQSGLRTFAIFDLQPDPVHPTTVMGSVVIPDTGDSMDRLSVDGTRVVIQHRTFGQNPPYGVVSFVDVSDPTHPAVVGSYTDVFNARGVAIRGNLVFVADCIGGAAGQANPLNSRLKGLAVLDISNPASPVLRAAFNTGNSSIRDVRVDGNRAYVFDDGLGLMVLDATGDFNPPPAQAVVGQFYSPGSLRRVTKAGNRLYVADERNGFTILDVSNPSATPVLGVYQNNAAPWMQGHGNVQLQGTLAFVSAGYSGIEVVDVSNPAAPVLVSQYIEPGTWEYWRCIQVELDGSVLHTRIDSKHPGEAGHSYFVNYDVSTPASILELGRCFDPGNTTMRTKDHRWTFYGMNTAVVLVFDNADPANPLHAATIDGGGDDLEVVGNRLYIADSFGHRTTVYDVTDPLAAVQLGSFATGRSTQAIGVGNRVYISGGIYNLDGVYYTRSNLVALDESNPASPQFLGYSAAATAMDILAEGDLTYSTYGNQGTGGGFGIDATNAAGLLIQQFALNCGTADFNCDGDVGTDADIEAFFRVLGGAPC